jgi:hypothetical protein
VVIPEFFGGIALGSSLYCVVAYCLLKCPSFSFNTVKIFIFFMAHFLLVENTYNSKTLIAGKLLING